MSNKINKMKFSTVYPWYIQKVERKGRTKAELNEIIRWLDKLVDELAKGKPMEKILRS